MSALPPKADIAACHWDVRFVPKADIAPPHSIISLARSKIDVGISMLSTFAVVPKADIGIGSNPSQKSGG
jgi:hypothetical protein